MFHPSPSDRNGSFTIRQADNQQLMPKTYLRTIDYQAYLSQGVKLRHQPLTGDGFVPFPYLNGRIFQQPAHSTGHAQQLCWAGYLPSYAAQTYRTALIDSDYQPDDVSGLSDALTRSQFLNPLKPGMIEIVGRHEAAPVKKFCGKNYCNRISSADQLFCC
jgi:hypothetical protein